VRAMSRSQTGCPQQADKVPFLAHRVIAAKTNYLAIPPSPQADHFVGMRSVSPDTNEYRRSRRSW